MQVCPFPLSHIRRPSRSCFTSNKKGDYRPLQQPHRSTLYPYRPRFPFIPNPRFNQATLPSAMKTTTQQAVDTTL